MLKSDREAYAAARQRVLDLRELVPGDWTLVEGGEPPPEVRAALAAEAELAAAEQAVADELQVAWQRNLDAVTGAKAAVLEARRAQARVEVECGSAARARDPRWPVLSEVERDLITAARAAVWRAVEAHERALARFKSGVTADQLGGVDPDRGDGEFDSVQ